MFGQNISSLTGKKRNIKEIMANELQGRLHSKQDFYAYLDKHKQYYLPPETQVTKDFLRDVFSGNKKLFKKKDVDFVHVPHFDELSVKNLWDDLKNDEAFNIYFQEKYADLKKPNRKYFFDIMNTIYPNYLQQIMMHASKQRYTVDGDEQRKKAIHVTDEWYAELTNLPYKSQKNGKTFHLLKQSAKKSSSTKKRKPIKLLGSLSEYKTSLHQEIFGTQSQANQSETGQNDTIGADKGDESELME